MGSEMCIRDRFDRQSQIYDMGGRGQLRQAYVSLAKASGLSEDEFISCLTDPDITARYDAFTQLGIDQGVRATPSIFINGVRADKNDFEALEAMITGEPVSEKADAE